MEQRIAPRSFEVTQAACLHVRCAYRFSCGAGRPCCTSRRGAGTLPAISQAVRGLHRNRVEAGWEACATTDPQQRSVPSAQRRLDLMSAASVASAHFSSTSSVKPACWSFAGDSCQQPASPGSPLPSLVATHPARLSQYPSTGAPACAWVQDDGAPLRTCSAGTSNSPSGWPRLPGTQAEHPELPHVDRRLDRLTRINAPDGRALDEHAIEHDFATGRNRPIA